MQNTQYCPRCGAAVSATDKFCTKCGFNLNHESDQVQKKTASNRQQSSARIWIFGIIAALIGLTLLTKPWVPEGMSSPTRVMDYIQKHDADLYYYAGLAQYDNSMADGTYNAYADEEPQIILLKNSKSNTFVFKAHGQYVYLAKIVDLSDQSYWVQAVSLPTTGAPDNPKHWTLKRTEIEDLEDIMVEDTGWTPRQFENDFDPNPGEVS